MSPFFGVRDITLELIRNYKEYNFTDVASIGRFSRMPDCMLRILRRTVMPNWIFLMHKKKSNVQAIK